MFEKNSMKKIIFQLMLVVFCLSARAQTVSNIRAEQRGQEIVVLYSLETTTTCEVSLWLSQDNGVTWGSPLKNVSGDVGKNISGVEKQITWKVLEEQEYLVGDKIKFKVVASGKKSFEPEMIFVEGGTFKMGRSAGGSDEKPVHSVTLTSYSIGKYEVTQIQWKSLMGNNPSKFSGCDNCPVENVSWKDVQRFISNLNSQTKKNYRLPTEAEWEYAAKGGDKSKEFTYSGSNDLNSVAWNSDNSGIQTYEVGSKQANELSIFDMSGNVWEWCSDWYGNYHSYSETNPNGPKLGELRVLRGGSWHYYSNFCRPESRSGFGEGSKDDDVGFRLVLPVE